MNVENENLDWFKSRLTVNWNKLITQFIRTEDTILDRPEIVNRLIFAHSIGLLVDFFERKKNSH